jgi:hypothetical protein
MNTETNSEFQYINQNPELKKNFQSFMKSKKEKSKKKTNQKRFSNNL